MKTILKTIAICGLIFIPAMQAGRTSQTLSAFAKLAGKSIIETCTNKTVISTATAAGIATYVLTKNNKYTAMAVATIPTVIGMAYLVRKSAPYVEKGFVSTYKGITFVGKKTFNGTLAAIKATGHAMATASRATGRGILKATKSTGHGIAVIAKSPLKGFKKLSGLFSRTPKADEILA